MLFVVAGFKYIDFKIRLLLCICGRVKYKRPAAGAQEEVTMLLLFLFSFPLSRACVSRIGPFRRYLQTPYLIGAFRKDSAKPCTMWEGFFTASMCEG